MASSGARTQEEQSRIRARQDSEVEDAGSGEYAAVKPPDSSRPSSRATESITERTARIDSKLSIASLLLERLPPLDARARLLSSAILRRDEVLIDAVLAEMTEEVVALASSRARR
ncbi:MAG TPA: hypothetical protein VHU80_17425 [Polyangiaceae bacterium]|jgi:hypothetical protein|nr:hypothetical protein [Polyangiaceae bacterium]